jgi:membrane-associated phospholipid phosphatase
MAVLVWFHFGHALLPAVSLPLVAWSRITLHHHTISQGMAGIVLGVVVFWVAFS